MIATSEQSWLGRLFLAIFGALFLSSGLSAFATTYYSDGTVANIQAIHHTEAADGDTIVIPAGTFSWTARLDITKGITLQGQTTITGAGTSNPTITDATVIKDDVPRSNFHGIVNVGLTPAQSFRMTGITFTAGTLTTQPLNSHGAFQFHSTGATPNTSMRMDHCHLNGLYQGYYLWVFGWVYGVADNNVFDNVGRNRPVFIQHESWGGQANGNGSWADYPWYGTDKFFFIEDNTFIRNFTAALAAVDSDGGARYVWRHNYMLNCVVANHGTEGGAWRGARAEEIYGNTFNFTSAAQSGFRSGTNLFHDNQFLGVPSNSGNICGLPNFRETAVRPNPIWGIADGTSIWDQNDTEGNGTYVEGHAPYLFDSGTDTSSVNSNGVIHDSTKNWTQNQWIGYSIKNTNPASPSYNRGSYVVSNLSDQITYNNSPGPFGPNLIFNTGDTYEIHRVLVMMDQNGRGKGDQLTGARNPINTVTGRASHNHQALEPCYSWNNIYTPNGHVCGFDANPAQPTTKINIDFFNLGGGFPANTTPSAVSSTYTAPLNGVDYVGPFVYPHPLVSSATVPTDVNGDGKPDYLLYNPSTRQTAIWYMNNNVRIGSAWGPTLPSGWNVVAP